MPRGKLSAIEIAEGALLADVAVIFQVIWMYVPVIGVFFRVLIPVVFTILCLRRGLYAGIISLCAALFLAGVITGPNLIDLIYLLLEGIGGLYLGVTMRLRLRDLAIVALGSLGLGASVYALFFVLAFVVGTPIQDIVAALHRDYMRTVATVDLLAARAGVSTVWHTQVLPTITPWVDRAFRYWWALLALYSLLASVPVMLVMYSLTNSFVRVLGYDVRPFPGGWAHRRLRRRKRQLVRLGIRLQRWRRRLGQRKASPSPTPAPADLRAREETRV